MDFLCQADNINMSVRGKFANLGVILSCTMCFFISSTASSREDFDEPIPKNSTTPELGYIAKKVIDEFTGLIRPKFDAAICTYNLRICMQSHSKAQHIADGPDNLILGPGAKGDCEGLCNLEHGINCVRQEEKKALRDYAGSCGKPRTADVETPSEFREVNQEVLKYQRTNDALNAEKAPKRTRVSTNFDYFDPSKGNSNCYATFGQQVTNVNCIAIDSGVRFTTQPAQMGMAAIYTTELRNPNLNMAAASVSENSTVSMFAPDKISLNAESFVTEEPPTSLVHPISRSVAKVERTAALNSSRTPTVTSGNNINQQQTLSTTGSGINGGGAASSVNNPEGVSTSSTTPSSTFGDPVMFPSLQSSKSIARGGDETTTSSISSSARPLGLASGNSNSSSLSGGYKSYTGSPTVAPTGPGKTSEVTSNPSPTNLAASTSPAPNGRISDGNNFPIRTSSGVQIASVSKDQGNSLPNIRTGDQGFYNPSGKGSNGSCISGGSKLPVGKNGRRSKSLKTIGGCAPGNLQCVLAAIGTPQKIEKLKKFKTRSIASEPNQSRLPAGVTVGIEDIFSRIVRFHNYNINLDYEGMIDNRDAGFSQSPD